MIKKVMSVMCIHGYPFSVQDFCTQLLGQRSKRRRSRKSKRSYIPLCNFLAAYFLCFLQAADRSSFTFRTPNKDQKVGKLFQFVIVQVSLPGDIQESCESRLFAWCPQARISHASIKSWYKLVCLDRFP